jgi:hypothetical protein
MSDVHGVQSTQTSIVVQLEASGDPGAELAALAVQSGETQRTGANEARAAYERAEASEDQREVDAMRLKANDIRNEAWTEGVGMVLQGGLEFGGSCDALDEMGDAPTQATLVRSNAEIGAFRGAGNVANGVATVMAAGSKAAQATDDANAALHRGNAELAKAAAEDMHDASKDAGEFVKAALDFYNGYVSSEAQTRAAALHKV